MLLRSAAVIAILMLISAGEASAQGIFQLNPSVYVGIAGGYSGGYASQRDAGIPAAFVAPPVPPPVNLGLQDGTHGLSGVVGSGIVGSSVRYGNWMFGLEGDFGGSTASGSSKVCGNTFTHTCGTHIDATSDVRGRIGYTFGAWTPFVDGGLAVDHLSAYDSLIGTSGSAWKAGYTVGGGLDYKVSQRVSLRVEYLHTDLGTTSLFKIAAGVPEHVYVRSETIRAAIVFDLYGGTPAPVVVAKY